MDERSTNIAELELMVAQLQEIEEEISTQLRTEEHSIGDNRGELEYSGATELIREHD